MDRRCSESPLSEEDTTAHRRRNGMFAATVSSPRPPATIMLVSSGSEDGVEESETHGSRLHSRCDDSNVRKTVDRGPSSKDAALRRQNSSSTAKTNARALHLYNLESDSDEKGGGDVDSDEDDWEGTAVPASVSLDMNHGTVSSAVNAVISLSMRRRPLVGVTDAATPTTPVAPSTQHPLFRALRGKRRRDPSNDASIRGRANGGNRAVDLTGDVSSDDAAASPITPTNATSGQGRAFSPAPRSSPEHPFADAPWVTHAYAHSNFTLNLHEEIIDLAAYLSPTRAEHALREDVVRRFRLAVRSWSRNAVVKCFGSFVSGLYLPNTGDLDVCVMHTGMEGSRKLNGLAKLLKRQGLASQIEVIAHARVPLVKWIDRLTGIHVDVTFDTDSGVRGADYLRTQMEIYPALRPLSLVLKYFLACRKLNNPYRGGVGSFLLQLMILAVIRLRIGCSGGCDETSREQGGRHDEDEDCLSVDVDNKSGSDVRLATKGRQFHSHNLGVIFLSFLEFYGRVFRMKTVGIDLGDFLGRQRPARFFRKTDWTPAFASSRRSGETLLCLRSPLDPSADVGSSSFKIYAVRKAFKYAHHELMVEREPLLMLPTFVRFANVGCGEAGDTKRQRLMPGMRGAGQQRNLVATQLSRILSVTPELRASRPSAARDPSYRPDPWVYVDNIPV